ncbi:MAG: LysE family translocator [Solirubrobacteraceae bacterium]|nr:LysE family translocator [Solirubrobacteraceae bacterium]
MHAFVLGLGLGALVAAQVGPVSLLVVRSVLRGSLAVGLAMAAAIGLVDLLYAMAGVAGAAPLLQIGPLRLVLGLLGAGVLVFLGARTLWSAWRVRLGAETGDEVATPARGFRTAFAATASNPLTIASWAAVFAATSTAGATDTTAGTLALLAGIGLGSCAWYVVLVAVVGAGRRHLGERALQLVDMVAGAGLIVFGGLLTARTLDDD